MARKKNRENDYIYDLEQKNRELKNTLRTLTRRLKKVSKGYYKYLADCDELLEQEEVQKFKKEVKKEMVKVCHDCGGEYKLIIVANRRFRLCQGCGKKGKVTLVDKDGNEIK
jgi:hypothetical protein